LQNSAFHNEFEGLDTSKSNGFQRNSLLNRTGNLYSRTGNLNRILQHGLPPGDERRSWKRQGSSLDQVVRAQVFLTDLNNFNGFDEVWKEYFKVPPPRTTIGTTGLLVKDSLVETDLICVTNV
jgi:hypothetical protein